MHQVASSLAEKIQRRTSNRQFFQLWCTKKVVFGLKMWELTTKSNLEIKSGLILPQNFIHFPKYQLWHSLEVKVDNTDTDEACDSSFEEGNFSPKIEFVEKFTPCSLPTLLPDQFFTLLYEKVLLLDHKIHHLAIKL